MAAIKITACWPVCLIAIVSCHGADGQSINSTADPDDAGGPATDTDAPAIDAVTTGETPPLGPSLFEGPPYARRPVPVRRLALGASADALCVILVDGTLYCENSGTDISARVPDNRDFVWVNATSGSDHYAAIRRDGSTANFHQFVAAPVEFELPTGRYIDLWSQQQGVCGLLDDGALRCTGAALPTALPPGPFVQVSGDYEQQSFMGLRVDGVLVSSSHNHLDSLEMERRFYDFEGYQRIPGCGRDTEGTLVCFDYGANDAVAGVAQPDRDLRDYAQYAGHVCLVTQDGRAACRAANGAGTSFRVPADARFVDIETRGPDNTCGITETGSLLCWNSDAASSVREIPLPGRAAIE
jgi:hypothetical protein